jgi:hypothetical protein
MAACFISADRPHRASGLAMFSQPSWRFSWSGGCYGFSFSNGRAYGQYGLADQRESVARCHPGRPQFSPLRSVEKHFPDGSAELQIPPLRYASVGMTKGRVALPFRFDTAEDEQQVPPLRFPGFPVELEGIVAPSTQEVDAARAIVGLRPSFSAHVRLGERGAPVDSLLRCCATDSAGDRVDRSCPLGNRFNMAFTQGCDLDAYLL